MERLSYIEKIRKFNRYYASVLGKIDQEIYQPPFPLTEARVIAEIHYRHGSTATEIRENLGIDRGYMSRMLQRFEEEAIITKSQSPEDKRQYLLELTEKGRAIFAEMVERANQGVGKMTQHLSERELSRLVTSMETIESIYAAERASDVTIRPFRPGDLGYIGYLHGKFYDEKYQFGRIFEYYVMKGLADFLYNTAGGEVWVAERNGEIIGSIAITKASDTEAQLRWFILDERHQGMGIGKKLMETALHFCRERGYQHVFLWTVATLEAARHLYRKYNFRLTEEKPNEEWGGTRVIEERWELDLSRKSGQ
ncbi:GNAT family N-acetyltransferase [Brevibacillus sp. GCM10020057]|uniref:bifunctional helix-turn-helix transcriptional regulator/GNAT family N-acetyltransferase n=1 Tax=Brevibacillus sp. GCM10020057 TaxID=3317327 RepID=UPI00363C5697